MSPSCWGAPICFRTRTIRVAHAEAKSELIAVIHKAGGPAFDPAVPILAFARRMTGYKRPHLLLDDPDRLVAIARRQPFQVVFAGKAHPRDQSGRSS